MGRHKGSRKPPGQKKPPLTHFLCLPLVTAESRPQLEASTQQFRDAVAVSEQASVAGMGRTSRTGSPEQETVVPGVHPKAIRPVGALHCTLGVMSLSNDKLAEAVELLQSLEVTDMFNEARKSTVQDQPSSSQQPAGAKLEDAPASLARPISPPKTERSNGPLVVTLKGLVSMHAPQKTSILYVAPSDYSQRLYPFCVALQTLFKDRGFLVPDDRPLKLHATVVNTIYAKGRKRLPKRDVRRQTPDLERPAPIEQAVEPSAKDDAGVASNHHAEQDDRSQGHGPNANAPLKIDAITLLERFKDFIWAENVALDRIAICEMGAKKIIDAKGEVVGGEYTEVAHVKLP